MARVTNKVTTAREWVKAQLEGVNGAPDYWFAVAAGDVKYGVPKELKAKSTVVFYVARSPSTRSGENKTAGSPYVQDAEIDFSIVGTIKAGTTTGDIYTACERMEQDILTAVRADGGSLGCNGLSSMDTLVTYEASEIDASQSRATAAKTTVVLSVTYRSATHE